MARYTGPNNKQSRRLGFSVLESGIEFSKGKKRSYGPGQHGMDRKRKPSNYSVQLTEKQKLRFMYQISEKQFKKLVDEVNKISHKAFGEEKDLIGRVYEYFLKEFASVPDASRHFFVIIFKKSSFSLMVGLYSEPCDIISSIISLS